MRHIITNFKPLPGSHCVSTCLRQIFFHAGYSLSEEMIFGLAAGLNFFYFEFKFIPHPIIGGRTRIGDFEESLSCNLGITIDIHKTSSSRKAYEEMKKMIVMDLPVIIYVDMNGLSYLALPENVHFGGHAVVVFGIDEEKGVVFISDRDTVGKKVTLNPDEKPADFHMVPLEELARARGSKYKPYPPENKWLTFDLNGMWEIDKNIIMEAIRETCTLMGNPPVKNLGLRGIVHFSDKLLEWKNFEEEKLKWAAFNSYTMINEIGGTGGGAFRRMYGKFLKECASIIQMEQLERIGNGYITISEWWDEAADTFYQISESGERELLNGISECIGQIFKKEEDLILELSALVRE